MALGLEHVDTFDRANGTLTGSTASGGFTWSASSGTLTVLNNRGRCTAEGIIHVASMSAVDVQRAQIVLTKADCGVMVRHNGNTSTASATGYLAYFGGSTIALYRFDTGANLVSLGSGIATAAPGDLLALEANGSTLNVYVNGLLVYSTTSATYTTGKYGVYGGGSGNVLFDNFKGWIDGGAGTGAFFDAPASVLSRTTGVAPFSVHCNLTVPSIVQPAGGAARYTLDYFVDWDDGSAGNWTHSGKPKSYSVGQAAGHVYLTAGTYHPKAYVIEADGTVHVYDLDEITVTAAATVFAGWDKHVDPDTGNNANSGDSGAPWATLAHGLTQLFSANGDRRLNIKGGTTVVFPSGGFSAGVCDGNYQIAQYGGGARPIWSGTISAVHRFDVSMVDSFTILDQDGLGDAAPDGDPSGDFVAGGPFTTMVRCRTTDWTTMFTPVRSFGCAYECDGIGAVGGTLWSATAVSDGAAIGAMVLGCYLRDAQNTATHHVRNNQSLGVFDACRFGGDCLTAMKQNFRIDPYPLHDVVVSNCWFDNTLVTQSDSHCIEIKPQTGGSDPAYAEKGYDFLVVGCRFEQEAINQHIITSAKWLAVRSCVFVNTTSPAALAVLPWHDLGQVPEACVFEFNTIYQRVAVTNSNCVTSTGTASNTIVRANIHYAPGSTNTVAPSGTVTTTNHFTSDPLFTNAAAGDFSLQAGSAAIDQGATRCWRDALMFLRGDSEDQGAYERGASVYVPAGGIAARSTFTSLAGPSPLLGSLIQ